MSSYFPHGPNNVVAIAGATGTLGSHISSVFLSSPYRSLYSEIRLYVRNPDSPKAQALKELGATLVKVDILDQEALDEALKGANAVINALGSLDHEAKAKLIEGVLRSNVALYIPSEFGVDHRFNGFDHIMWTNKQHHINRARTESGGKLKVVAIYAGFFLETAFNAVYGVDKENKRFNIIGSKDIKSSYTSLEDIAHSTVQITTMALGSPSSIPDDIRIAGTTVSWDEIKSIIFKETGESFDVVSLEESESFRKKTIEREGSTGNAREYIRLLMSEGKIDFSTDNQNELINPEETLWKWTTMEDYVKTIRDAFI